MAHYQLKLFCIRVTPERRSLSEKLQLVDADADADATSTPTLNTYIKVTKYNQSPASSMQINKTFLLANCYLTNANMGFSFLTSFRTVASRRTGLTLFRGGAKSSSSALFSSSSRTALDEVDEEGAFKRQDSAWRNWISSEKGVKFPPELDRYHLFVAYACRKYTRDVHE